MFAFVSRSVPSSGLVRGSGARLRHAALLLPIALALSLGACAKGPRTTGSIEAVSDRPLSEAEIEKAASYWGERYARRPKDKAAALNYAAALRRNGHTGQAVAILQKVVLAFPEDREIMAAYGKALAADGQLDRALQIIRRAQTPDRPDWRLMSAEAAILDQKGMNREARKIYLQARDYAPSEPTILSNLGMSYLLTGNLPEAETSLRQAAEMPGADSRIRQNLALVVGLQGRFDEAKEIASAELSPDQAAANVAYLKAMLEQQNSWQKLKATDTQKPG
jgi:Flp pilus assembly protein TadD